MSRRSSDYGCGCSTGASPTRYVEETVRYGRKSSGALKRSRSRSSSSSSSSRSRSPLGRRSGYGRRKSSSRSPPRIPERQYGRRKSPVRRASSGRSKSPRRQYGFGPLLPLAAAGLGAAAGYQLGRDGDRHHYYEHSYSTDYRPHNSLGYFGRK